MTFSESNRPRLFANPWSALIKVGWIAHAAVVLSAFLSLMPSSPGSYPLGLVAALVLAMPLSIYAVILAIITGVTWSRHTHVQRVYLCSILFLLPVSYGLFALISWMLFPNG